MAILSSKLDDTNIGTIDGQDIGDPDDVMAKYTKMIDCSRRDVQVRDDLHATSLPRSPASHAAYFRA